MRIFCVPTLEWLHVLLQTVKSEGLSLEVISSIGYETSNNYEKGYKTLNGPPFVAVDISGVLQNKCWLWMGSIRYLYLPE